MNADLNMTAIDWAACDVDVVVPQHEGSDPGAPVGITVVIDDPAVAATHPTTAFLEVAAGGGWDQILAAAGAHLRGLGCPGEFTWAGGIDEVIESCGCSWAYREISIPRTTTREARP